MIRIASLLLLLASATLAAQPAPTHTPPRGPYSMHASGAEHPEFKPFVGTWRLVSSTEKLPDGRILPYGFGPRPAGYLIYDANGYMCAQVMNADRPKWADEENPTAAELKTAFDGFAGYCGRYTVDAKAGTAAHIPEIGFDPNLAGHAKPRNYRFENGRLVYSGTDKTPEGEVVWTMTWERVN